VAHRRRLREELGRATDRVWSVEPARSGGAPSLADADAAAEAALKAHPLVQAALAVFPEGELVIGRPPAPEPELASGLGLASAEAPGAAGFSDDPRDENPDVVYEDDLNFGDWEPDD